MKELPVFFLLLVTSFQSFILGQTITFSGTIRDEEGYPVEGVIIKDISGNYLSQSDDNGKFSVVIQPHSRVCFSKAGFNDTCIVGSQASGGILLVLPYKVTHVKEVTITKERANVKSIENVRLGVLEIRTDSINRLPTLTGEVDPLKIIQLTPGVGKFELTSGLMVRGSTMDQNLVIFDEGMIYNPTHLAGFISMFNPYIVEKITLTKTGMPVNYGGRVSSLLMAESDRNMVDKTKIEGNIGLLLSNVAIRAPIGSNSQLTIAFRRSYLDYTIKPFSQQFFPHNRSLLNSSEYSFYDGNILWHLRISKRDNLKVSIFRGNDDFTLRRAAFDLNYSMKWLNQMVSMQWSHYFSARHIALTSAYYTRSDLNLFIGQNKFNYTLISTNEDFSVKHEHRFFFEPLKCKVGVQLLKQLVVPNKSEAMLNELQADFGTPNDYHLRTVSAYVESEIMLSHKWSVAAGIRENFYSHMGPFYQFTRNPDTRQITDTVYYAGGSIVKNYYAPDIQFSLRCRLDSLSAIKFHASHNTQFVQQVNVTTVALPTDFWLPASNQLPPLVSRQLSTGYYRNWQNGINVSVELFYKWFNPVIEFNKGLLQSLSKATMEENILLGRGRSYGVEFYVAGAMQKWNGWISYTISRSERIFAEINQGRPFPSKYDRLHDLTLVLMHPLNSRWTGSLTFTYASGQATTLPVGRYLVGGNIVNQYTDYNSFRMPPYHRLDVAFTRKLSTYRGVNHELVFSIYNLYGRLNPYFMYFKVSGDLQQYKLTVTPQYVSLFPMMPSVSYRFSY